MHRRHIYIYENLQVRLSGTMEQRIDRSCLPRKVLHAIEIIYEYLPKSLLTEIRISKQDGSFCIPTSGTSPSPPPYDVRAQQSVQRNVRRLAVKSAKRASRKIIPKSLEEIGEALQAAKRSEVPPETVKEAGTYLELYIDASNADKANATYCWHMLGMQLRKDEDLTKSLKIREASAGKLFRDLFPHISPKAIEYDLSKARRIYDVTRKLSGSQILSIENISAEDIRKVTKKNLSKILKYCK
jgi:hypothetical protein